MHRFQVNPHEVQVNSLILRDQEARHLSRVLRLGPGDEIAAFDNSGLEYRCRVEQVNQDEVLCTILESIERATEARVDVFLLQGLPKADKMELIVQKTTELGVRAIYPVRTSRAIVQLDDKKGAERVGRWQKIAAEAAKQCSRTQTPEIKQVADLAVALGALPTDTTILMAYEGERAFGLKQALSAWRGGPVAIAIGPEGGFSEKEIALFVSKGAVSVSLGPRILRTETAAIAALTMVLCQVGDLG